MKFHSPSPVEFREHQGTCPLEIGRFTWVLDTVRELTGPLPIYKIFTNEQNKKSFYVTLLGDEGEEINHPKLGKVRTSNLRGPIPFLIGEDNQMYVKDSGKYLSVTQVGDKN